MSELQDAEVVNDDISEGGTSLEAGAELAPDSAEEREEKDPAKLAQEQAQKAINKQHAKFREEERKRIETERKAKELEDRLAELEARNSEVVVPPIPDQWDEDYETKLAQREEALLRKAKMDAAKELEASQRRAQEEAREKAERERMQGLVNDFDSRIVKLGLDAGEVEKAAQTVVDYGVDGELVEFILQHEEGPLITQYLAANPLELDDLRGMSRIQAAIKLNSSIREAASALRPVASGAPDPVETLSGRGPGEKKSPLLNGATFE